MERCNYYLVRMIIGMFITIIGMAIIIGSLVRQIDSFKQQNSDQSAQIQKAYEERNHNPIVIQFLRLSLG